MFLSVYEAILPFLFAVQFGSAILVFVGFVGAMLMLGKSLLEGDKTNMLGAFKTLAACLFVGALVPGFMISATYATGIRLVPDLAIKLSERDQLATLIAGIVTLGFTLYDVWRRWEPKSASGESEAEELQALASNIQ